MMISEPEPTDVIPTTTPPTTPRARSASGRTVDRAGGPAAAARHGLADARVLGEADVGANDQPAAASSRAIAERDLDRRPAPLAAAEGARQSTPPNAAGTEPTHSHFTSPRWTVPRRRWTSDRPASSPRSPPGRRTPRRAADAEEEHEHRRHQRAAAHAGQADDDADAEGGDRQWKIELTQPLVCHIPGLRAFRHAGPNGPGSPKRGARRRARAGACQRGTPASCLCIAAAAVASSASFCASATSWSQCTAAWAIRVPR